MTTVILIIEMAVTISVNLNVVTEFAAQMIGYQPYSVQDEIVIRARVIYNTN